MRRWIILACTIAVTAGCGTVSSDVFDPTVPTQMPPYISRIEPANGAAGAAIEIHGFGFSAEPANNVVVFGSVPAFASNYVLVAGGASDDVEAITVTVPAGAIVGINDVSVTVFDNTSNANLTFTVNP